MGDSQQHPQIVKGIRHESRTRMAGLKEEAVEFCRRSLVKNEIGRRSSRMILIENLRNRLYIKRDQTALDLWIILTIVKSRLDPIRENRKRRGPWQISC